MSILGLGFQKHVADYINSNIMPFVYPSGKKFIQ